MKPTFKYILIFASVLLLSAGLAPFIYSVLPQFKFEKIFNRVVMILTLLAVVFFIRVRRTTFERYGLVWNPDSTRYFATAFLMGVATLFVLACVRVAFGDANWLISSKVKVGLLLLRAAGYLSTALLIGVIEEFFFRGFIFSVFKDHYRWNLGLSMTAASVIYSIVHFIAIKKPFIELPPDFVDGLRLIAAPFMSLKSWPDFWSHAMGLFIFGMILNLLVVRTGSLYPSIGLHAGCVFFLKMDNAFFQFLNTRPFLFGTDKVADGVLGWLFLALLGWGLVRIFSSQANRRNFVLAIVLLPILICSSSGWAEEMEKQPTPLYRFEEHLSDAEARNIFPNAGERVGTWEKDRFLFVGTGDETVILATPMTFAGMSKTAIYFHPLDKGLRRLRFDRVPPGSKLVIRYGIEDSGVTNQVSNVYLKIWVGKYEIKRIRIPNEKGWKTEKIDLGVLSFLKRPFTVVFEITADTNVGRYLGFQAEIYA